MEDIKVVFENRWIIEKIYEESERLSYYITDTSRFEERCIEYVARYLNKYQGARNSRRYIQRLIMCKSQEAKEVFKKEHYTTFGGLAALNEDGDELEYEPEDVLANVESEVITKETIDLLAQDDRRKRLILGSWLMGNDNVSDISRLLAQTIGGNAETHRKFIQRFRSDCRIALTA